MIEATCFTNLDEYQREEWPKRFAYPPRKGERVESKGGHSLVVVQVTHLMRYSDFGSALASPIPMIRVELHR